MAEGRPQHRHCPHLGLKHTRAIRFSNPTPEHRCYIFGEPLPVHVDQRSFCLSEGYVGCPRVTGEEAPPATLHAGLPTTVARRERGPSLGQRLAGFWHGLGTRDRILYLSLVGVFVAILATYGIIAGVVLPARNAAPTATPTPTSTMEATTPVEPTQQPTVPPTTAPTDTVPPPTEVLPTATSAPTRTPQPTGTSAPPTDTPAAPTDTPVVVVPTDTPVEPTSPPPPPPTSPPDTMWSTLYFLDASGTYYVPVNREVDYTTGVARRAIEEMIAGPRAGSNLLRSIPAGMSLNDVWREGVTLYVDFSHRFEELGAGQKEALAVVLAMTEFSTVQQVQFLANGTPVGLPGSGDTGPVGRPSYVNFENPYGLAPEESVALTLYFLTSDWQHLFPIVRRVPFTEGTARAAIMEMVQGPTDGGLSASPLPSTLEVLSIDRQGSTIVVDFNGAFWEAPNQYLAINALALAMSSLTADSPQGVDSVSISVEGSVLGTYFRPVLNPE